MENINIYEWSKEKILKYCKMVENTNKGLNEITEFPMVNIKYFIRNDFSNIVFGSRTVGVYNGSPYYTIDKTIPLEDIEKIIDFVLTDHDVISDCTIEPFKTYNPEYDAIAFSMIFNISKEKQSSAVLNCNTVEIRLEFLKEEDLASEYIDAITSKYEDKLVNTPYFKVIQEKHFQEAKGEIFNDMDKDEMIKFIKNNIGAKTLRKFLLGLKRDEIKEELKPRSKR